MGSRVLDQGYTNFLENSVNAKFAEIAFHALGGMAEDETMLPVLKDPGGRHPHGGERWVTIVGRGVGR